jgi:hypothetical protein
MDRENVIAIVRFMAWVKLAAALVGAGYCIVEMRSAQRVTAALELAAHQLGKERTGGILGELATMREARERPRPPEVWFAAAAVCALSGLLLWALLMLAAGAAEDLSAARARQEEFLAAIRGRSGSPPVP